MKRYLKSFILLVVVGVFMSSTCFAEDPIFDADNEPFMSSPQYAELLDSIKCVKQNNFENEIDKINTIEKMTFLMNELMNYNEILRLLFDEACQLTAEEVKEARKQDGGLLWAVWVKRDYGSDVEDLKYSKEDQYYLLRLDRFNNEINDMNNYKLQLNIRKKFIDPEKFYDEFGDHSVVHFVSMKNVVVYLYFEESELVYTPEEGPREDSIYLSKLCSRVFCVVNENGISYPNVCPVNIDYFCPVPETTESVLEFEQSD